MFESSLRVKLSLAAKDEAPKAKILLRWTGVIPLRKFCEKFLEANCGGVRRFLG